MSAALPIAPFICEHCLKSIDFFAKNISTNISA